MALSPNFSVTQTLGAPSKVNLEDLSSGTDILVVSRRVYIATPTNKYLVQSGTTTNYELWPNFPSSTSITLDVLPKDYATTVTVEWVDAGGNVLYSKSLKRAFTAYNEEFDYATTQRMSGNPLLINDDDFYKSKSDLRTNIDSGNKAMELAGDLFGAQQCYDRATQIRVNSKYNYNEA